ncbi:mediator of RNA polymerase II transcription subunit 25-like isoform X2 [Zophobas morio]|uniref:mediator of RNA polymerase II transcription subunit 25-like isoform X2 n=1 Tax=Zophobas morio TaxID=2755281 RepID=UPI0030834ECE
MPRLSKAKQLLIILDCCGGMASYFPILRERYVYPILRYFLEKEGSEVALVIFRSSNVASELEIVSFTPELRGIVALINDPYFAGGTFGCSLAVALKSGLELFQRSKKGSEKYCVLCCNTNPYKTKLNESSKWDGKTCYEIAREYGKMGIALSVITSKKLQELKIVFREAGSGLPTTAFVDVATSDSDFAVLRGIDLPIKAQRKEDPRIAPVDAQCQPTIAPAGEGEDTMPPESEQVLPQQQHSPAQREPLPAPSQLLRGQRRASSKQRPKTPTGKETPVRPPLLPFWTGVLTYRASCNLHFEVAAFHVDVTPQAEPTPCWPEQLLISEFFLSHSSGIGEKMDRMASQNTYFRVYLTKSDETSVNNFNLLLNNFYTRQTSPIVILHGEEPRCLLLTVKPLAAQNSSTLILLAVYPALEIQSELHSLIEVNQARVRPLQWPAVQPGDPERASDGRLEDTTLRGHLGLPYELLYSHSAETPTDHEF